MLHERIGDDRFYLCFGVHVVSGGGTAHDGYRFCFDPTGTRVVRALVWLEFTCIPQFGTFTVPCSRYLEGSVRRSI